MYETRKPNCVGHAYFIRRIIPQERYVQPPKLGELPQIFQFTDSVQAALIIAMLRGDKLNPHPHDEVEHMIARIEESPIFSSRIDEGLPIKIGPASKLLADFRAELGVHYPVFLIPR